MVYALALSIGGYRSVRLRDVIDLLKESAQLTATIMFIVASASVFGLVVTYEQVPKLITEVLGGPNLEPLVFLIVVNLALLVVGIFLESMSLMIIVVPVLAPLGAAAGVDPLHLGIVLVLNFVIASLTPPVGTVVYTVAAITGVRIGALVREFIPFFGVLVAVLVLTILFPCSRPGCLRCCGPALPLRPAPDTEGRPPCPAPASCSTPTCSAGAPSRRRARRAPDARIPVEVAACRRRPPRHRRGDARRGPREQPPGQADAVDPALRPDGPVPLFVKAVNEERIDLSHVHVVHMDEFSTGRRGRSRSTTP